MTVHLRYMLNCDGRTKKGSVSLNVSKKTGEDLLRWQHCSRSFPAAEKILAGIAELAGCEAGFVCIEPPTVGDLFQEQWKKLQSDELSEERLRLQFEKLQLDAGKERERLVNIFLRGEKTTTSIELIKGKEKNA